MFRKGGRGRILPLDRLSLSQGGMQQETAMAVSAKDGGRYKEEEADKHRQAQRTACLGKKRLVRKNREGLGQRKLKLSIGK